MGCFAVILHDTSFEMRTGGRSQAYWGWGTAQTNAAEQADFRIAPEQLGAPIDALPNVPNLRQMFCAFG
jgi:hypothetical protein